MHQKGGYHISPSKTFCHTVPKLFVGEHFGVSENFVYRKNFMHKKRISLNSVEKFLSHSADKIHRRTLLCFEIILVSKIFKQGRGKLHGFVENFFVSQDRNEKLCKGTLMFSRNFLVSRSFMDEKGGITFFPSKIFGLTVPKNFVGIRSMFQKIWGIEKFYA